MTAHPIDTEALRREALGQIGRIAADPRWPGRVLVLLDALEAANDTAFRERAEMVRQKDRAETAEHRATRAEAQAAIRGRAVVMYRERAREAEARVKAVEDVLRRGPYEDARGNAAVRADDIRRALEG